MSKATLFLFFLPVVTGSFSLVASASIVWKIMRSETKLSSPYSRLIFGLCVYDIISSLANALSAVPSPPSPYGREVWGAFGNYTTCRIQGFMFTLSSSSSPFYNLSLCIYYLCLIRYSMRDESFGKKIEPILHIVPFLYSFTLSVYFLVHDNYHFNGTVCWIHQSGPENLNFIRTFGTLTIGLPLIVIFFAVIGIMGLVTYTVWSQENRMNQYRFELGTGANGNPRSSMATRNETAGQTRRRRASEERIQAVQTQANLYAFAFILTLTFPLLYRFMSGSLGVIPPKAIIYLARGLYPLQGIFNLFAHMHPQVVTTRRSDRNLSYIQAFCIAFKSYEDGLDRRTRLNSNTRGSGMAASALLSTRASRRSSRHLSSIGDRQTPTSTSSSFLSSPRWRGTEGSRMSCPFRTSRSQRFLNRHSPVDSRDQNNASFPLNSPEAINEVLSCLEHIPGQEIDKC